MMTPEETSQLADAIVARLDSPNRISSALPAWFARDLAKYTGGSQWFYKYVVPMGAEGFVIGIKIQADASIEITIYAMDNRQIWQGTLTSA